MPTLWGTTVKVFFFFILLFNNAWGKEIVEQQANFSIEQEDRSVLESFFQNLLKEETIGYVLMGEKPVCFMVFTPKLSWKHPIHYLSCLKSYRGERNQLAKKAWEIWEKYSPCISDRFLLVREPSPYSPFSEFIYLIHHDLFCQTVNQYRADFEKVLKRPVTGEMLFEEAKRRPLFSDLLQKHEGLLGILLGYGRNNAWLFSEKTTRKKLGFFPKQEDQISEISLPYFRVNWKDPETLLLQKKYIRCRDEIKNKLLNDGALDQIMKILFDQQSENRFRSKTHSAKVP